jgi:flagellar biosynthesis protein FlhA
LFGHEEAQELLDRLSNTAPRLVQDTIPGTVSLRVFVKVLQNLLGDGVPLRDVRRIVEALADHGLESQDVSVLTNGVRAALKRHIVQEIFGIRNELPVLTLDGQLEQILLQGGRVGGDSGPVVEPNLARRLQKSMAESVERREIEGEPAVLLVSDGLREIVARFARLSAPGLRVLSFAEIPEDRRVRIVATVGA